jgi:hypothetical protein
MKKSVVIVLAGIILVILAILFFMPKQDPTTPDDQVPPTQEVPADESIDDAESVDIDDTDLDMDEEEDEDLPEEPEELPEVTPEDVAMAVLEPGSETEEKFLTTEQKKELRSPGLNNREPEEREEKNYMISWSDTSFDAVIPTVPSSVPVYLFDRPVMGTVFDFIKELGSNLGLSGAVIRMNPQTFALANIQTGEYFMTFDMYHLMFEAANLEVLADNNVADTMKSWGLLGFPYVEEERVDDSGNSWTVFVPDLELPVITMQKPTTSGFTPDTLGEVQVKTDGDYIMHIISRFPNITEKEDIELMTSSEVSQVISEGSFDLGEVQLQYPGALSIEQRKEFFDVIQRERVRIEEGTVSRVDCGYFLEGDRNLQALLNPVCVAEGGGKVNDYSVLFKVVFPAVN